MFDILAFIIGFFLTSFLILIILVGVKFLYNLATLGQSNNRYNEEINENSKEDSNGDGLLGIDEGDDYSNILFPEEFSGEEEDW